MCLTAIPTMGDHHPNKHHFFIFFPDSMEPSLITNAATARMASFAPFVALPHLEGTKCLLTKTVYRTKFIRKNHHGHELVILIAF